jgi:hypothetical protein
MHGETAAPTFTSLQAGVFSQKQKRSILLDNKLIHQAMKLMRWFRSADLRYEIGERLVTRHPSTQRVPVTLSHADRRRAPSLCALTSASTSASSVDSSLLRYVQRDLEGRPLGRVLSNTGAIRGFSATSAGDATLETAPLDELRRELGAPDLQLEDSLDTGDGRPAKRDAGFTVRLLQYLVQRYRGRVHPNPLAVAQSATVRDLLYLFAKLDRDLAVREGRDTAAWRAWRLQRFFGVSSMDEIPPNVTIDARLLPDAPSPGSVPYNRRKIRERLRRVLESARASTSPQNEHEPGA